MTPYQNNTTPNSVHSLTHSLYSSNTAFEYMHYPSLSYYLGSDSIILGDLIELNEGNSTYSVVGKIGEGK